MVNRPVTLAPDWTAIIMDRSKYIVLNRLELSAANQEKCKAVSNTALP
jgi:hypothetical protein